MTPTMDGDQPVEGALLPTHRGARFVGRSVLVTGGASGIGLACALRLAEEGATTVVLLDPDTDALATAVSRFSAIDVDVVPVEGGSTDAEVRRRAVAALGAASGAIVINAGATFLAKGVDATADEWRYVLENNVIGYALMTADAVEHLAGGGAVINVASVSAHIAQPTRWTYNAAKGAIVSLTRCQAMDLAPRGIRVNSISPAWIWTPVVARMAGDDERTRREEWGAYHLLRRVGEVEEVAAAVAFLASDDASFITATDLPIDGGYLAVGGEGVGAPDGGVYGTLRSG